MQGIYFDYDLIMLIVVLSLAVLLYLAKVWRQRFEEPSLYYPKVDLFSSKNFKVKIASFPDMLKWGSLGLLSLALIDPHFLIDRKWEKSGEITAPADYFPAHGAPKKGIALYFVLDRSGSMAESIRGAEQTKIDLVKDTTKKFIAGDRDLGLQGRPNDLVGLVYFARGASVESPLTLDHDSLLKTLEGFSHIGIKEQDGTSIGYAIFKTVNLIAATRHYAQELAKNGEAPYSIQNSVIILVTDGMQDPNPLDKGKRLRNMDIPEAAQYAKENGVRLYMINVEPKLNTAEFSANRNIMKRAAELTGGAFYTIDSNGSLIEIYTDINQVEKSTLPAYYTALLDKNQRPDLYRRIDLAPFLILLALIALVAALLLETTILRKVP